jgi:DNA-binding transcriptional ArsR family regulator
MNISTMKPVSELLQSIGPDARILIILAIGEKNPCVCHLEATFGWRQAYLSQHLMAMRKAGILLANRKGRNIHYRLKDHRLLEVIQRVAELQGVKLPQLAPSVKCGCQDCANQCRKNPARTARKSKN